MVSMDGVSSSLILRNESWVRQQAQSLMRRLPSNVEKADLIQVGLIGVAQAAITFKWDGDPDCEAARESFVQFARARVKGAMLDELRQMDRLGRTQRRQVKAVQLARQRWQAARGVEPRMEDLGRLIGLSVEEIAELDLVALSAQVRSLSEQADGEDPLPAAEAATEADEVEARVDTGILLRRLETFFAALPERDRQVIDSYLGVGLSPAKLAESLNVSPSRVSQIFNGLCKRIGIHLGHVERRSTDRSTPASKSSLETLIDQREEQLDHVSHGMAWGRLVETACVSSMPQGPAPPLGVSSSTRWG